MTNLQTKDGKNVFHAVVQVENVQLKREGDKVIAYKDGEDIGVVRATEVIIPGKPGSRSAVQKVKVADLVGAIDVASLVGKDPLTLSPEELQALMAHLQSVAEQKASGAKPAKAAKASSKPAAKKPAVEDDEDFDDEDEDDAPALPKGISTYEDLAALDAKTLWAKIVKAIASELEGISSRSKKDKMLEAAAEYYGLSPEDEEDEDDIEDDVDVDDEDEDDFDDEDEDEDDDYDEDEEDDEDDDEDEDDEDDEEDDEDEDDDEDDEDITEDDVDALVDSGDKKVIAEFCRRHGIKLPNKRLSVPRIKEIIKDALFD